MARELSERTVAIRKALRESKGKLTYSQAVEQKVFPESLGVTQKVFDATKFNWVQGKKRKKADRKANRVAARNEGRVEAPAVEPTYTQADFAAAIKVVNKAGGRDALRAKAEELSRHLAAFDSFAALSKALAG